MKVRATKLGFLQLPGEPGRRMRPGEVFTISDAKFPKGHKREGQIIAFSPAWMEPVDAKPSRVRQPSKEEPEQTSETSDDVI